MRILRFKQLSTLGIIFFAIGLGLITGYTHMLISVAEIVGQLFIKLIQLISMPFIFLLILSGFSDLKNVRYAQNFLARILTYPFGIILTITSVCLGLVLWMLPIRFIYNSINIDTILRIVPNNMIVAFTENNVLGVVMIALLFGGAMLKLPQSQKETLNFILRTFLQIIFQLTKVLYFLLPLGIWAFTTLLIRS